MLLWRRDVCKNGIPDLAFVPTVIKFGTLKKLLSLLAALIPGFAIHAAPLEPGSTAPAITATNQNGEAVALQDVYAKGLTLVYFYPKADTSGCTAQACSFRDAYAGFQKDGLTIYGVSRDGVEAQKKFKEKYQIPFDLIADVDGKVAEAFGVDLIPVAGLTKRQSFLIRDGKIVWTSLASKTKEAAKEVQAALDKL